MINNSHRHHDGTQFVQIQKIGHEQTSMSCVVNLASMAENGTLGSTSTTTLGKRCLKHLIVKVGHQLIITLIEQTQHLI